MFQRSVRHVPAAVLLAVSLANSLAFGWPGDSCDLTWTLVNDSTPTPRYRHAMAYDSARDEFVVFGGYTGETDTWIWHPSTSTWERAATTGPSRRGNHTMEYDPVRDVILLVGGDYNGTTYKDVWEWNGATATWTQRESSAWLPEARSTHAMVFDAGRGHMILYGGLNAGSNATKTLEFDGNTWSSLPTSGDPGIQMRPAMAYDSAHQLTVLLDSGLPVPPAEAPVWELDPLASPSVWAPSVVPSGTPTQTENPLMVFDAAHGELVSHGGLYFVDASGGFGVGWTWTNNGTGWTYRGEGPRRQHHAMAYDTLRGETLVFSGNYTYEVVDAVRDLQVWNGFSWATRWSKTSLRPVWSPQMEFFPKTGKTILFGGARLNPVGWGHVDPSGLTWEWDGSEWSLLQPAHSPGPRFIGSMVYDSVRDRMVLFGGLKKTGAAAGDAWATGETWFYDGIDWSQGASAAAPRVRHAAAYDSTRDRIVVFGGGDGTVGDLGTTLEFDGSAWSEVAIAGPSARHGAMMVYDASREKSVLFGGVSNGVTLNDTWEWDGRSWNEVSIPMTARPPARERAQLAYDSDLERVVLVGGRAAVGSNVTRDDAWVFDGQSWTPLAASPALAKTCAGFAYDSLRKVFVFAGGAPIFDGNYITAETWEATACEPNPADLDGDGIVGSSDLAILLGAWGLGGAGDIDGDGEVDAVDLSLLIGSWT